MTFHNPSLVEEAHPALSLAHQPTGQTTGIEHHTSRESFVRSVACRPNAIHVLHGFDMIKHAVEAMARLLGIPKDHRAFPGVRDIRFDPYADKNSIALSVAEHPLHIDGTFDENPPSGFLLGFKEADPLDGGVSTFVPIAKVLSTAPVWVIRALQEAEFVMARTHGEALVDEFRGPLLSVNVRGETIFRWRHDEQVSPQVLDGSGYPALEAVNWVVNTLNDIEPETYTADVGDLIYVRNVGLGGFLHGRTALSPDSPRHVYRVWLH